MQERPNTCTICQQKAFGYNYEVVSCNACKMFFRRCTLEKSQFLCKHKNPGHCFDGDNLAVTRPRCRFCRLQKCITMGMRVRSSEEESEKSTASSPGKSEALTLIPTSKTTTKSKVPQSIVIQEQYDCTLIQYLSTLHKTRLEVYSVINIDEDPGFLDLVTSESKLGEYARPRKITWESTKRRMKPWGSLGVLVIVELLKTLDAYKELLLSDRVLLLKNVAFKLHHLAIAYDSFVRKKGRVFAPHDLEMFPPALFQIPECKSVVLELLTQPMGPLIDLNLSEQEFLVLNMILICNPGIAGLSPGGQKILSDYQRKYSKILLNLCLIKNTSSGPSRFAEIISINQKLDKQVFITQKLDFVLRIHWDPSYYFPQIMYEACRMINCHWLEKRIQ